jgi:hypothetical protein
MTELTSVGPAPTGTLDGDRDDSLGVDGRPRGLRFTLRASDPEG